MENSVKINNILFDNVLFLESGENIIFAKDVREEFFGVYNVSVLDENIICEGKSNDHVVCNLSVGDDVFENTSFRVKKSNKNQIVINSKNIKNNELYMEKIKMSDEIMELKRQIKEIDKSNRRLLMEENNTSKREELLTEFFDIKNQNDILIEEKIQSMHGFIMESVEDRLEVLSKDASKHFRDVNELQIQNMTEEMRSDILIKSSDILEEKLLFLENSYSNEMDDKITIYSDTSSKILEDFRKAKKDTEVVLEKHLNESTEILKENFAQLFEKYTNEFKDRYLLEFNDLIEREHGNIKNQSNQLKDNLSELFEKYTTDFKEKYIIEFNDLIKKEHFNIKNQTNRTNQWIDKQKTKINDLLEKKSKEIENKSNEILLESSNKIKVLTKKIETLENQLNKINSDKKKTELTVKEANRYTDLKMDQVLNEAKRFARLMMDFAGGGGGGSVAVQYAGGGTMGGNLTVNGTLSADSLDVGNMTFSGGTINGDLDVNGTLNANRILSGNRDLTKVFAGEGGDDDNLLNGGQF
jgi:hypothetical protein